MSTLHPFTLDGHHLFVRRREPARPAVLYLHDHDPSDLLSLDHFASEFDLIAPLGGASFWSPRRCPSFHTLLSAHEYIVQHLLPWIVQHHPSPLAIVGRGVGGQAALRIAFQHADRFPIAASWEGALDLHDWYGRGTALDTLYERREQVRQDTAVLHIRQHAYPRFIWFGCTPTSEELRGHDRLHEKLGAVGVPHTFALVRDTNPHDELTMFLREAMAKQARRLL